LAFKRDPRSWTPGEGSRGKDEASNIKDIAETLSEECKIKDNTWRKSVFEIETEDLETLPIQDIAIKANANEEFGFEIGPICFS